MHHPGPPRFVAVGDVVELAPRDPDPEASYKWRIARRPVGSSVTVGDAPVERLSPDRTGTYVARLFAPDGAHDLTVRAFPGSFTVPTGGASGARSGARSGSGSGVTGRSGPRSANASGRVGWTAESAGDGGRPRLTLRPSVEDGEAVVRADASGHPDGAESAADLHVEFLLDDRDDVDRETVETGSDVLRAPLSALDGTLRVHAVAVGESGYSVPDAVTFTRAADGSVSIARPHDPPEWARDAVIYEIYVRTFSDGEGVKTAFDAMIDRLDYVDSLGVDTLWLTPVLENDDAPHGYNITDFTAIAADLGTRADYERFVEAAHDRGMRVLFDLVLNHSARTHPFFEDAARGPSSEYRDWYEWEADGEPGTYFGWEHIANFDFESLEVRRHLLDAVDRWASLVDGFRCDMAWAVPDGFWRELHDRLKAADPAFLLLDETIPYVPDFQAGRFGMHFDSTTYHALHRVGHGDDADRVLDAVTERRRVGFPDYAGFMLYAENHDEERYLADCGREAAKAAAGALFTLPGAPMVYAGQEFGQLGRRDALAWEHADEALRAHYAALADARAGQPALTATAAVDPVDYDVRDGDAGRVVAYRRSTGEHAVVVALHFGEGAAVLDLSADVTATDLVSGESVAAADGAVTVDSVAVLPAAPEP